MDLRKFSIFVGVGIASAVIDIGVMQLLIRADLNYVVATTLGFFAGLIANFFLHTHVTFRKKYSHSAFARFICVVSINYLLTLLAVSIFQITLDAPLIGKFVSLPLVAINGFFLSKKWVYR
jgi:putative flippase GtrA